MGKSEVRPKLTKKRVVTIVLLILAGSVGYYLTWNVNSKSIGMLFTPATQYQKIQVKGRTLLNDTNFEFVYNPKEICSSLNYLREKKTLISFVHSTRANFRARQLIRATWGSVYLYENWYLPVVFLLGSAPPNEQSPISEMLEKEFEEHRDLVVGNFIESEKNMTYKHLMGYKWVTEYCHRADYYMKADQDTLIDVFHIVDLISVPAKNVDSSWTLHCTLMTGSAPERDGPYVVTREQFAPAIFPDYCGYSIYVTQIESIREILAIHDKVKPFAIDNAFVTGVLREYVSKNKDTSIYKKVISIEAKKVGNADDNKEVKVDNEFKQLLGYIVESKRSNVTCQIWKRLLKLYGLQRIYVSTCNAML